MNTVRIGMLWALTAAAAVACGASESTRPTESPDGTVHGAYARCLSEHGVTESGGTPLGPGPSTPPPGVDQPTWDAAQRACAPLAPGPPGPAG